MNVVCMCQVHFDHSTLLNPCPTSVPTNSPAFSDHPIPKLKLWLEQKEMMVVPMSQIIWLKQHATPMNTVHDIGTRSPTRYSHN